MLKPSPEDTEVIRPPTGKVEPVIARQNMRQTLHARVLTFLGFTALLTAAFIKPLFLLATSAGTLCCAKGLEQNT